MRLRRLTILLLALAGAISANGDTSSATSTASTVTLADIKTVVDEIRTRLGNPACPAATGCSVAGNIETLMDRGGMAIIQVISDPDPNRNGYLHFFEVKKYILLGNTIPGVFRDSAGSPRAFGYEYTSTREHRLPQGRYLIELLQPAPTAASLTCAMSPSLTVVDVAGFHTGGRPTSCRAVRLIMENGTPSRRVLYNGAAIFNFDGVDDSFMARFKLDHNWIPVGTVPPTVTATVKVTKLE